MFYSMRINFTGSLNLGTADRVAVWVNIIVTATRSRFQPEEEGYKKLDPRIRVEKAVGNCGDIV